MVLCYLNFDVRWNRMILGKFLEAKKGIQNDGGWLKCTVKIGETVYACISKKYLKGTLRF